MQYAYHQVESRRRTGDVVDQLALLAQHLLPVMEAPGCMRVRVLVLALGVLAVAVAASAPPCWLSFNYNNIYGFHYLGGHPVRAAQPHIDTVVAAAVGQGFASSLLYNVMAAVSETEASHLLLKREQIPRDPSRGTILGGITVDLGSTLQPVRFPASASVSSEPQYRVAVAVVESAKQTSIIVATDKEMLVYRDTQFAMHKLARIEYAASSQPVDVVSVCAFQFQTSDATSHVLVAMTDASGHVEYHGFIVQEQDGVETWQLQRSVRQQVDAMAGSANRCVVCEEQTRSVYTISPGVLANATHPGSLLVTADSVFGGWMADIDSDFPSQFAVVDVAPSITTAMMPLSHLAGVCPLQHAVIIPTMNALLFVPTGEQDPITHRYLPNTFATAAPCVRYEQVGWRFRGTIQHILGMSVNSNIGVATVQVYATGMVQHDTQEPYDGYAAFGFQYRVNLPQSPPRYCGRVSWTTDTNVGYHAEGTRTGNQVRPDWRVMTDERYGGVVWLEHVNGQLAMRIARFACSNGCGELLQPLPSPDQPHPTSAAASVGSYLRMRWLCQGCWAVNGTYSDAIGPVRDLAYPPPHKCRLCPAGTYMREYNGHVQASLSFCLPCQPGTYNDQPGLVSPAGCPACPSDADCPIGSTTPLGKRLDPGDRAYTSNVDEWMQRYELQQIGTPQTIVTVIVLVLLLPVLLFLCLRACQAGVTAAALSVSRWGSLSAQSAAGHTMTSCDAMCPSHAVGDHPVERLVRRCDIYSVYRKRADGGTVLGGAWTIVCVGVLLLTAASLATAPLTGRRVETVPGRTQMQDLRISGTLQLGQFGSRNASCTDTDAWSYWVEGPSNAYYPASVHTSTVVDINNNAKFCQFRWSILMDSSPTPSLALHLLLPDVWFSSLQLITDIGQVDTQAHQQIWDPSRSIFTMVARQNNVFRASGSDPRQAVILRHTVVRQVYAGADGSLLSIPDHEVIDVSPHGLLKETTSAQASFFQPEFLPFWPGGFNTHPVHLAIDFSSAEFSLIQHAPVRKSLLDILSDLARLSFAFFLIWLAVAVLADRSARRAARQLGPPRDGHVMFEDQPDDEDGSDVDDLEDELVQHAVAAMRGVDGTPSSPPLLATAAVEMQDKSPEPARLSDEGAPM